MRFIALGLLWVGCACAPMTLDHTPANDVLDEQSSDLEAGIGRWQPWFSTTLSHQVGAAAGGEGALEVLVTAPFGWGIGTNNYPGFSATPGVYRATFWARSPNDEVSLGLELQWRDLKGNALTPQPDTLDAGVLGRAWKRYTLESTAPDRTAYLEVAFRGRTEAAGLSLAIDEVRIYPRP